MAIRRRRRRFLPWNPDPGTLAVVRVLLFMQAGFAFLNVLEVTVVGIATGTIVVLVPVTALTAVTALGLSALPSRLERHSLRARRIVVLAEALVLLFALVDLGLALLIAHAPLDLVPTLTRIVLPLAVIRLLRRERERTAPSPQRAETFA